MAQVETRNVDWISVLVNGRLRRSYDVNNDSIFINLTEILSDDSGAESRIEIQGFKGNQLVAATRMAF